MTVFGKEELGALLRGRDGEENFCFVTHRRTHIGTPRKLEKGLTAGVFPKDVLKKLPQGLAMLVGLSP